MIHVTRINSEADPSSVAAVVIDRLTETGFRLDGQTRTTAELSCDGCPSTRANALHVADRITILQSDSGIELKASMDGANDLYARMCRLGHTFGIGWLIAGTLTGVVRGNRSGVGFGIPGLEGLWWMGSVVAWVLVMYIVAFIIARRILKYNRRRGIAAIDELAADITARKLDA